MTDTSHLTALMTGLSNERSRLAAAKSENERQLRRFWVAQYEKQIADERVFLGMALDEAVEMSDEELLAELTA